MERKSQPITVGTLLEDPLFRKHFPRSLNRGILESQLYNRELMRMDLDAIVEMDVEDLLTRAFVHGLARKPEEDGGQSAAASEADAAREAPPGSVTVLVDGMGVEAKVILNKPADGCPPPGAQEIRRALLESGVTHGVLEEYAARLAARPIYGRKFKIAQGTLPTDGEDGKVLYYFDTSTDLTPKVDENGVADYRDLDYAKNVRQGEVLCEIIPPTQGANGYSIHGEVISGKSGAPVEVVNGANTYLSEDKRKIIASCDGRVHLKGGKVTVSRVLNVDRVDNATGNILFVGAVEIRGDVEPGFTVRAGGDITVGGVAENATLISGGNIVICGGIKGKDGGFLDAGGSLRTLFVENARVRVKENIYADSILNSQVECGQTVSIAGVNGCLRGGRCVAGRSVQAMELGNSANIPTYICLQEVGSLASRQAAANLRLAKYKEAVERLRMVAQLTAEKNRDDAIFSIILVRVIITKQRLENEIRLMGLKTGKNASFVVRTAIARETLYPNVTVEIDGETFKSVKIRKKCALSRSGNRIVETSDRYY